MDGICYCQDPSVLTRAAYAWRGGPPAVNSGIIPSQPAKEIVFEKLFTGEAKLASASATGPIQVPFSPYPTGFDVWLRTGRNPTKYLTVWIDPAFANYKATNGIGLHIAGLEACINLCCVSGYQCYLVDHPSKARISWYATNMASINGYVGLAERVGGSKCWVAVDVNGQRRPFRYVAQTFMHEGFGHCLGWYHLNDKAAMMYPSNHDIRYPYYAQNISVYGRAGMNMTEINWFAKQAGSPFWVQRYERGI